MEEDELKDLLRPLSRLTRVPLAELEDEIGPLLERAFRSGVARALEEVQEALGAGKPFPQAKVETMARYL